MMQRFIKETRTKAVRNLDDQSPKKADPITIKLDAGTRAEDDAAFISKDEMKSMLQDEYNPEKLEASLKNCCTEHKKCSEDLARLADCVEELARMKPAQYVDRVAGMEVALQEKCHEIKKSRGMIAQLMSQAVGVNTKVAGTNTEEAQKHSV